PALLFRAPPRPPGSTLFPYTTLFRSRRGRREAGARGVAGALHALRARSLLLAPTRPGPDRAHVGLREAHGRRALKRPRPARGGQDRTSTRLNSSHVKISYAVFCLKKK